MARVAVLLALILAGCTTTEYVDRPVEVLVPVQVERRAPEWLVAPYQPAALPRFIHPSDPAAKAALSEQGLADLKVILRMLKERDNGWRAWAVTPAEETPQNVQPE